MLEGAVQFDLNCLSVILYLMKTVSLCGYDAVLCLILGSMSAGRYKYNA